MAKKLQFIQEQVSTDPNVQIVQEGLDETGERKIIIRANLQSIDPNRNGRVYPPETLQAIVQQLSEKAQRRALLAEVDHPMPLTSDAKVLQKRATTIHIEDAGALITDLQFDGQM